MALQAAVVLPGFVVFANAWNQRFDGKGDNPTPKKAATPVEKMVRRIFTSSDSVVTKKRAEIEAALRPALSDIKKNGINASLVSFETAKAQLSKLDALLRNVVSKSDQGQNLGLSEGWAKDLIAPLSTGIDLNIKFKKQSSVVTPKDEPAASDAGNVPSTPEVAPLPTLTLLSEPPSTSARDLVNDLDIVMTGDRSVRAIPGES